MVNPRLFKIAAFWVCENKQEHRLVVAHGEASYLLAGDAITYIDILVSWTVAVHRKRCHHVPQIFLEPVLFSEHKLPNCRMETICSNHHIEAPRFGMLERNAHPAFVLVNLPDAVAEKSLTTAFDLLMNDPG